jgi:hypothetical protein
MLHAPLLLALTLALAAGEPRPPTPVLVELFTSEACDNCPGKEELLGRLAKSQPVEGVELVPLAFHMDAYDHLGWKDRFGQPEASQRQRRYNAVHHHGKLFAPHMVVDSPGGSASGCAWWWRCRSPGAGAWRASPPRRSGRSANKEGAPGFAARARPEAPLELLEGL